LRPDPDMKMRSSATKSHSKLIISQIHPTLL